MGAWLVLGSLLAIAFGFVLPLLALAGAAAIRPSAVVAGMLSSIVFVVAYFSCEMVHYGVLNRRLLNDRKEWGRATGTVIFAFTASSAVVLLSLLLL